MEGVSRLASWEAELTEAEARISNAVSEEDTLLEELRQDALGGYGGGDVGDAGDAGDTGYGDAGAWGRAKRRIPPAVPPKPERRPSREEFDERNRSRLPPYLLVKEDEARVARVDRINITNQVNALAGHFANISNDPTPNKSAYAQAAAE